LSSFNLFKLAKEFDHAAVERQSKRNSKREARTEGGKRRQQKFVLVGRPSRRQRHRRLRRVHRLLRNEAQNGGGAVRRNL